MTLSLIEISQLKTWADSIHLPGKERVLYVSSETFSYVVANGHIDRCLGFLVRIDEFYKNKQFRVEWYS